MCKDNTQPLAKYIDAQDVPILKDVGRFTVLLTQLEMNNVTNNLPIYETAYKNFSNGIALITTSPNFSTIFSGATFVDGYWRQRYHRLTTLTGFNITYFNGSGETNLFPNRAGGLENNSLFFFSTSVITPPSVGTTFGTINDASLGPSFTVPIDYFNISDDGLHLYIIADDLGSSNGNTMNLNLTFMAHTYTGLSLTFTDAFIILPLTNKRLYTFTLGSELTPVIPKQERCIGTYTTTNATELQFFINASIVKKQPAYTSGGGAESFGFPYEDIYTPIPLFSFSTGSIPDANAMPYFYTFNDLTDCFNYAFDSFFYYINGTIYTYTYLTIGSYPSANLNVSTNAPYIKYENNTLKLYLDPYGFINQNYVFASNSSIAVTPTCLLNYKALLADYIWETEILVFNVNAALKDFLAGFSTFIVVSPATDPNNYWLIPDVYKVEPEVSTITGMPKELSQSMLYTLPIAMKESYPNSITYDNSQSLLTVGVVEGSMQNFEVGKTYIVAYSIDITARFVSQLSLIENTIVPFNNIFDTAPIIMTDVSTTTTSDHRVTLSNLYSPIMTVATNEATNFVIGNNYIVTFTAGNIQSSSSGTTTTMDTLNGYYKLVAINDVTTTYGGYTLSFEIQDSQYQQLNTRFEYYWFSNDAEGSIYSNSTHTFYPPQINGTYELYSINNLQNSLTFKIPNLFSGNLTFKYFRLTLPVGNVYLPLPYTQQLPTIALQSKYKEQVNMVLQSEIQNANINWFPIDAIVITTTNIPVQKEYNTKVLQANETNNVGNNTNKGTFLNILHTIPISSKASLVTLPTIPEHKKNYMMTLNTELKVIDVQFWWKKRLTNELIPLTMPKNSSILFKLRFRKER
jgi:hypothetical protein